MKSFFGLLFFITSLCTTVSAQTWPAKPIHVIVPFAAGCGTARPVVWEDGGGDLDSYPITCFNFACFNFFQGDPDELR